MSTCRSGDRPGCAGRSGAAPSVSSSPSVPAPSPSRPDSVPNRARSLRVRFDGGVHGDGDPHVVPERLGERVLQAGAQPALELVAGELVRDRDDRGVLVDGHRPARRQPGALARREVLDQVRPDGGQVGGRRSSYRSPASRPVAAHVVLHRSSHSHRSCCRMDPRLTRPARPARTSPHLCPQGVHRWCACGRRSVNRLRPRRHIPVCAGQGRCLEPAPTYGRTRDRGGEDDCGTPRTALTLTTALPVDQLVVHRQGTCCPAVRRPESTVTTALVHPSGSHLRVVRSASARFDPVVTHRVPLGGRTGCRRVPHVHGTPGPAPRGCSRSRGRAVPADSRHPGYHRRQTRFELESRSHPRHRRAHP